VKILQLDFMAFGPFTDLSLGMREGKEGLHLIVGPNEAGKSSALRGLIALFYGIHQQSPDDFVHRYEKMRLGGLLRCRDGRELAFVRRKGKKDTLLRPDGGGLLQEAQLRDFLGGVDKDLFKAMFGLDHERLVEGGREILLGRGEVGEVLFEAAAGISSLRKVRQRLREEAEGLFLRSGRNQAVNKGAAAYEALRKEIARVQASAREWVERDEKLGRSREDRKNLEFELVAGRSEQGKLDRMLKALPFIGKRREILTALDEYAGAPVLPPDFGERWNKVLERRARVEHEQGKALEALGEIVEGLEKLEVPESLLGATETIEALVREQGSYEKAQADRIKLAGEHDRLKDGAVSLLGRLKPGLSLEQAESIRPVRAEDVRLHELAEQGVRLRERLAAAQLEKNRTASRLQSLSEKLADLEVPPDAGPLRQAVNRCRREGDLEERLQGEVRKWSRTEQEAKMALGRQSLWKGDLEVVETLPLPLAEAVDETEAQLSQAESLEQEARRGVDEAESTIRELGARIEESRLQGEVPSEEDLDGARSLRDRGWGGLRRRLEGESPESESGGQNEQALQEAFPAATGTLDAFELSLRCADDVADRLRREADRVANMARLSADRQRQNAFLEVCGKRLDEAQAERIRLSKAWESLWQCIGVSPRSPKEMRSWSRAMAALVDAVADIRRRRESIDVLERSCSEHVAVLCACLEPFSEQARRKGESLADLLERCGEIVERVEWLRKEREGFVQAREKAEADLADAAARTTQAHGTLEDWQREWAEAVGPLGLDSGALPKQALTVLDRMREMFSDLDKAGDLNRRLLGIDQDAEHFTAKARDIALLVAPELAGKNPVQVVGELNQRLMKARENFSLHNDLKLRRSQEEERRAKAEAELVEIRAALESMRNEAGCGTDEEVPRAVDYSSRKRRLKEDLEHPEETLRVSCAGVPLEDFISEALAEDPDAMDSRLVGVGEEIDRLERHRSELDQAIGRMENELTAMDGGDQAAILAEQGQSLLAGIAVDAEHYIRLQLALEVLDRTVERFREHNEGPIIKRASELFSRLTLGSFKGLRPDFTDQGKAVVGIRPDGCEVPVAGMSEGTRDQLYLAVRLAGLERFFEEKEPLPFIVDDILLNFDDERAGATLEILAELSAQTQVIFFTHHQHLVDLVRDRIPPETFFLHTLKA
jgi:uncharacterized protein YhaN